MPEIKNTFVGGKMNKDLDERLIPNGQYRDAFNVEVSTAEGPGIGVVKNILGNKRVDDIVDSLEFTCVGSIANEKTNKLYWFITTYEKDAILEYDVISKAVLPVVIDLNAGNENAVLRFGVTPIITGINIIDNLLLWTDNTTDPKKINIDTCKEGTTINVDGSWNHTKLNFESGSFDGLTIENILGTYEKKIAGLDFSKGEGDAGGRYFWFSEKQMTKALGIESITHGSGYYMRQYRNGQFLKRVFLVLWNQSVYGTHGRIADSDPTYQSTANNGVGFSDIQLNPDFIIGDVLYGDDVSIDIEERHITVIKPKPLLAPAVKINYSRAENSLNSIPNLFETKFPRFSYRYKFRDGEFSSFAPFTNPVFNPKYPKDKNNSTETNVYYNKDNAYDIKEPGNKAMTNSIHSIELTDFITSNMPQDVVSVDILYKQENSSVIYSIGTVNHIDSQWHLPGNTEGYSLGYNKATILGGSNFDAVGGYTKGKYIVTTENVYAALPANQLLRPWDNVPRRALAQEVTGNRVVYGNYLQNYNLGNHKTKINLSYSDRNNSFSSFEAGGLPSIKSQRNYQMGVVYCDEYGRETPVFTSNEGAVSVPWADSNGLKNASRSLQLNAEIATNFPSWVETMRFFVKETSNEYYNLVMSRAWVVEKTYELDNSEGHIWISFPSSDRNKISEGDYIILKKKVGTGEQQISNENKFKVIDISNQAPEAIKFELVEQGSTNKTSFKAGMVGNADMRIDKRGCKNLYFSADDWASDGNLRGIPLMEGDYTDGKRLRVQDLYASWSRSTNGVVSSSKKYKILSGRTSGGAGNLFYVLKLRNEITDIDADLAHSSGDSEGFNGVGGILHPDLTFRIDKRELRTGEDFSGSFFVKIAKNEITNIVEGGNLSTFENFAVAAKKDLFWWRDDVAGNSGSNTTNEIRTNDSNYGLTRYNGYDTGSPSPADNGIHNVQNNVVGNSTGSPYLAANLRLTDFAQAWQGIYDSYIGNLNQGRFFLDGMHMVAGQSEASDYAKYCCVTWSGALNDETASHHLIKGDSAWKYPPLKTWLGDYSDKNSVLENLQSDTPLILNNMLLSTSNQMNENSDWGNKRVDGWIGHSQHVDRKTNDDPGSNNNSANAGVTHVNGLEGLVTSVNDHAENGRRWFSGITGGEDEFGNGVDTKTYSESGEVGRYFMHLSFFAPGADLHNGNLNGNSNSGGDYTLFGENAVGNRLQGIWGGGHFTGEFPSDRFGTDGDPEDRHSHLCLEGNYDANGDYLGEAPGPNVGFGYDLDYKELHERQWDPTFPTDNNNVTRDFIRKLHAGSQFRFHPRHADAMTPADLESALTTIYTIKSVSIKKLYNHTSWRNTYNRWENGEGFKSPNDPQEFWSVEKAGINWLSNLNSSGSGSGTAYADSHALLLDKIKDFGKSHNRRLCYIIELDKDPTEAGNFNPIDTGMVNGRMTADHVGNGGKERHEMEFLEKTLSVAGINDLNKFPAIWETDPRKQEVDLDIYFGASSSIPVKLNNKTNEIFAPLGCVVEPLNAAVISTSHLVEWNDNVATFDPGFQLSDGTNEVDYSDVSFKFTKGDGSFVVATADTNILTGLNNNPTEKKTTIVFRENIGDTIRVGLSWNNCFSFGNGIESNRINDDFNEMFLLNGVRASITTQQTYEEERRSTGLIYSGLYNSNSGVNDLNQFLMAEKITKDLNPTFGSIQKLFQRRISLVALCEDRIVSITSNKDAIFNADGNSQLIASDKVLGDANPFEGNYGISKNPESFASESYRAYFTDKNRGAVLRLSKDGITPISTSGMHDWFRDNLPNHDALIGTFDSYKEDYNITLSDSFGENLLFNSYLGDGVASGTVSGGFRNSIKNANIYDGEHLIYPYEQYDVATNSNFTWGNNNPTLATKAQVINHAKIEVGDVYSEIFAAPASYLNPGSPNPYNPTAGTTATYTDYTYIPDSLVTDIDPTTGTPSGDTSYSTYTTTTTTVTASTLTSAVLPDFAFRGEGMPYAGALYDAVFNETSSSNPLFSGGGNPSGSTWNSDADSFAMLRRRRVVGNVNQYDGSTTNVSRVSFAAQPTNTIRESSQDGSIVLKTMVQSGSNSQYWVEWNSIGDDPTTSSTFPGPLDNPLLMMYNGHSQTMGNDKPYSMFDGDEIEITLVIQEFPSYGFSIFPLGGFLVWNRIQPYIELRDGAGISSSTTINPDKINSFSYTSANSTGTLTYDSTQTLSPHLYFMHDQNANKTSGNGWQAAGTDWHRDLGWHSSPIANFPLTKSLGSDSLQNFPDETNIPDPEVPGDEYTCKVSFKFTTPHGNNNQTPGQKVINNLNIRIGQTEPAETSSSQGGSTLRQSWKIKSLKIDKISNIQSPFQPETGVDEIVTEVISSPTGADVNLPAVIGVDPIPMVEIPAWTEVKHFGINGWGVGSAIGGGTNESYTFTESLSALGGDATAEQMTSTPNDQYGNPVAPIYWLKPDSNYDAALSPHGTSGYSGNGISSAVASPGLQNPLTGGIINPFQNSYYRVETIGSNAGFDMQFPNQNQNPFVDNNWYLVDVEFENSSVTDGNTNTGMLGGDGEVVVHGVVLAGVDGDVVNSEGVGVHSTSSYGVDNNIRMVQVNRSEYGDFPSGPGDNKTILRAIFKFDPNSWRAQTAARRTNLVLRFLRFTNGTKITKIITKHLGVTNSFGEADDWVHHPLPVAHSFSKRKLYYEDNKLCWENVSTDVYTSTTSWNQTFPTGEAPQVSSLQWRFRFRLSNNPNTGTMSGKLGFRINNKNGDFDANANTHNGVVVAIDDTDMTHNAIYEFTFNFDGDSSGGGATPIWTATKDTSSLGNNPVDFVPAKFMSSSENAQNLSSTNTQNKLTFYRHTLGADAGRLTCAVSEILLTDETEVLVGGTSESWSWNGFDDALDNFITWDVNQGRIQYEQCPAIDPSHVGGGAVQISASQKIDLPVKLNEKYRISLDHNITSGSLSVYYFNDKGRGFRVFNITDEGPTSEIVTVGNHTWSSLNPLNNTYSSELKNSFVIRNTDNAGLVNGFIDNISMVRLYDNSISPAITVSFSEKVNGWTSFKDFVPENGLSLSKKYFTFKGGGLWQHYVPLQYDVDQGAWIDSDAETATNYNSFYNSFYPSSVTAVLNQEPSLVKLFNTLNYEGSQSLVKVPTLIGDSSGHALTVNMVGTLDKELSAEVGSCYYPAAQQVTINNVAAWNNFNANGVREDILGWNCTSIKTDLEAGSVMEFIDKEGKWFSYIKGNKHESTVTNNKLLSVQGLGVVSSITSL